ncbi:DUF4214 domain-containing protein [Pseudomonas sp. CIP-10]|uniref:DUF4214 domain-containing protein n=1 Tax=Pseudomonas sp. CIP-10 TaxID=2892442 RepID=UPI001E504930|nr:DUF4214 domain-containing protein [Pseudomonas sp. CIP-10]UFH25792.1 DUF4214 domain-containing protein [Pseudomonas sp. CIP-10]
MQYDNPVAASQLQEHLDNSTLSAGTVAAISSLLNLTGEDTTVGVASFDGVNLQLPTNAPTQVVTGAIAGQKGDQVTLDLSAAEAAGASTYILESDANLVVTLQGNSAAPATFAAFAAADIAVTADDSAIELVVATGNGDDVITVNGDQNTHIDAGDGNDTIVTGNGNNTVIAGAGNNNVKTGSGNDTVVLSGINHADIVDTGAGFDVVQLDGSRADYNFATGNSFNVNLTSAAPGVGQTASITNAELLTFVNGDQVETVALAHSEAEASALRLFQGILDRDVDQDGAKFFVDQVNQGTSLTDIANQFLNSSEFAGAANEASINELYASLLGRTADEDGAALFQEFLANGGSLADAAALISVSEEAQNRDQSNGDFVRDLYTNVLGRDADEDGLTTYVSALFNGTSRADVAKFIVGSEEAAQKSTSEFIDALYGSALGRGADEAGKAFWTAQLESGLSQADVALSIIGSPEAADHIDNVVVLHGQV